MRKILCFAIALLLLCALFSGCAPANPKLPEIDINVGWPEAGKAISEVPISVKVNGKEAEIVRADWSEYDKATGDEPVIPSTSKFRYPEEATYSLMLLINMGDVKLSEKDRNLMTQDQFTVSDAINVDETYGIKAYWDDGIALEYGEEYYWVQVWMKDIVVPVGSSETETKGDTYPENMELTISLDDVGLTGSNKLVNGTRLDFIKSNAKVVLDGSPLTVLDVDVVTTDTYDYGSGPKESTSTSSTKVNPAEASFNLTETTSSVNIIYYVETDAPAENIKKWSSNIGTVESVMQDGPGRVKIDNHIGMDEVLVPSVVITAKAPFEGQKPYDKSLTLTYTDVETVTWDIYPDDLIWTEDFKGDIVEAISKSEYEQTYKEFGKQKLFRVGHKYICLFPSNTPEMKNRSYPNVVNYSLKLDGKDASKKLIQYYKYAFPWGIDFGELKAQEEEESDVLCSVCCEGCIFFGGGVTEPSNSGRVPKGSKITVVGYVDSSRGEAKGYFKGSNKASSKGSRSKPFSGNLNSLGEYEFTHSFTVKEDVDIIFGYIVQ